MTINSKKVKNRIQHINQSLKVILKKRRIENRDLRLQSKSSIEANQHSEQRKKLSRLESGASIKSGKDQFFGNYEKLEVIEESMKIENTDPLSVNAVGTQDIDEEESYIDDFGGKVNETDIIDLDKWLCELEMGTNFNDHCLII